MLTVIVVLFNINDGPSPYPCILTLNWCCFKNQEYGWTDVVVWVELPIVLSTVTLISADAVL